MFFQNNNDQESFGQLRVESRHSSGWGKFMPSPLTLVAMTLFLIALLSAYSSLFIVDKANVGPQTLYSHTYSYPTHDPDYTETSEKLWNCLGRYTTVPAGYPICIQLHEEIRMDERGAKFITSSAF